MSDFPNLFIEERRAEQAAAARQLRELCGWLDAASAAADAGLLDHAPRAQ